MHHLICNRHFEVIEYQNKDKEIIYRKTLLQYVPKKYIKVKGHNSSKYTNQESESKPEREKKWCQQGSNHI